MSGPHFGSDFDDDFDDDFGDHVDGLYQQSQQNQENRQPSDDNVVLGSHTTFDESSDMTELSDVEQDPGERKVDSTASCVAERAPSLLGHSLMRRTETLCGTRLL